MWISRDEYNKLMREKTRADMLQVELDVVNKTLKRREEEKVIFASSSDKSAYRKVLRDLLNVSLFCGKYDKTNGSKDYIFGVKTVMDFIVHNADVDGDRFDEMFYRNME